MPPSVARIADLVACILLPIPSEVCAVDLIPVFTVAYSSRNLGTDTLFVLIYVCTYSTYIHEIWHCRKPGPADCCNNVNYKNLLNAMATSQCASRQSDDWKSTWELSHELTSRPAPSTYEYLTASQSLWPFRRRIPDPPQQPTESTEGRMQELEWHPSGISVGLKRNPGDDLLHTWHY